MNTYIRVYYHGSGYWIVSVLSNGVWHPIAKCKTKLGAIYKRWRYKKERKNTIFINL